MRGWQVFDIMDSQSRDGFTQLVQDYEIVAGFPIRVPVQTQASGKYGPYQKEVVKDCILVIFDTTDPYVPDSVTASMQLKGGADGSNKPAKRDK